ncbi:protein kinase domain-containing protein [Engelhardtia mirabilis]
MELRPAPEPEAGDLVGGYRLVQVLGEGGFGRVWRAQTTAEGMPDVALKLIKAGTDTAAVLRRFRRERDVLAQLGHSGIASIKDAGRSDGGRPYLVMELVDGPEITAYVRQAELQPAATLALFVRVCRAVEHAHDRGILHRDLKPSNVLVLEEDGEPRPKVIDFGIASVLAADDDPGASRTEDGRRIGSPLWMSPEQAGVGGAAVDARSDVFALGRLLHCLLVGSPAVDLGNVPSGLEFEALEDLFMRDAPSPRREARVRGVDPVPKALDAIVRRASATHHDHRYPSAQELREDVERYLAGELVLAAPPGIVKQSGYWLRRHRAALIPAAALLLGLAGVLASAEHGRALSREANKRLEATVSFQASLLDNLEGAALAPALEGELLEQLAVRLPPSPDREMLLAAVERAIDPVALARSVIARGVLDPVQALIEAELGSGRAETAQLAVSMIEARRRFGLDFERGELAEQALGLIEAVYGANSAETRNVLLELANVARRSGELERARTYFERLRSFGGNLGADTRRAGTYGLAQVWIDEGRPDKAEPALLELLAELEAPGIDPNRQTVNAWVSLAAVYEGRLDHPRALEAYERAVELVTEGHLASDFPGRGPEIGLARTRSALGDLEGARVLLEEIVEDLCQTLGVEDDRTTIALSSLARARQATADFAGALEAMDRASLGHEARATAGHPTSLQLRAERVQLLATLGRCEEALALCDASLELAHLNLPVGHEVTAKLLLRRVVALAGLAQLDEALAALDASLAIYEARFAPGHAKLVEPYALAAQLFEGLDAMRPDQGFGERARVYRELLE